MSKNFRIIAGISALIFILGAFVLLQLYPLSRKEINLSELNRLVGRKAIVKATIVPTQFDSVYQVSGSFIQPGEGKVKFEITTYLSSTQLAKLSSLSNVSMAVPGQGMKGPMVHILSTLLIVGVVAGALIYQMNLGKSRTKKVREKPTVRLKDVAGVEEAKAEVHEIVDFLRDPKKYKRLGGVLPKGVLLVGPPGTGKTMLAKAIAGEAEANFFSVHGSDFNEVYVGVGAKRVRELFRQAAKHKPAIIFIDEIDCLGKDRKTEGHGEYQQTNNALLAAMDGFESSDGIVVIGATNRPEDLDEALLRPGRFDRKVQVPIPDIQGRKQILLVHAKDKPIAKREQTLDVLAQTTSGMSGAELACLINEAALLCAKHNVSEIDLCHLEESRDKVRWGKERKSMILRNREREIVACHEAGHTIVNLQMNLVPPLHKVTIIPRGNSLGSTMTLPKEDQNLYGKKFLLEHLQVLMGGRVAEQVFFNDVTNGANGDLDSAKNIASKMICEWGMGDRLYYDSKKTETELEIDRILKAANEQALQIIEEQKENTKKLADALLSRETLSREEVLELLGMQDPVDALEEAA